jgi:hypothetical protein
VLAYDPPTGSFKPLGDSEPCPYPAMPQLACAAVS